MWFGGLQRPEETESDFPEVVATGLTKSGKCAKFLREYFSGGLISCAQWWPWLLFGTS